jgi:hypothetical protein
LATQTESVVTPERYDQGIGWKQWMETIDRNQDQFAFNYEAHELDEGHVAAIKALMAKPNGPARCLALGEAWCTDVVRGLPVMARLAEATGLDLKIFFRDQNLDFMQEFLYKGEYQSIPVFVFYTKDHKYIGHWIEKAKLVREQADLLSAITSKMRDPDISQEDRQKYMAEYAEFKKGPIWAGWRNAEVQEIRELLEENCK